MIKESLTTFEEYQLVYRTSLYFDVASHFRRTNKPVQLSVRFRPLCQVAIDLWERLRWWPGRCRRLWSCPLFRSISFQLAVVRCIPIRWMTYQRVWCGFPQCLMDSYSCAAKANNLASAACWPVDLIPFLSGVCREESSPLRKGKTPTLHL